MELKTKQKFKCCANCVYRYAYAFCKGCITNDYKDFVYGEALFIKNHKTCQRYLTGTCKNCYYKLKCLTKGVDA